MQRKAQLLLTALILILSGRTVVADDNSARGEFEIRRQYMHSRVEDFYTRQNQKEKEEDARQRTADDERMLRDKVAARQEVARKEYVQTRRDKVEVDPSKWEAETKALAAVREKQREDFVRRRDIYNRDAASFDTIPENDEVGIESDDDGEVPDGQSSDIKTGGQTEGRSDSGH